MHVLIESAVVKFSREPVMAIEIARRVLVSRKKHFLGPTPA